MVASYTIPLYNNSANNIIRKKHPGTYQRLSQYSIDEELLINVSKKEALVFTPAQITEICEEVCLEPQNSIIKYIYSFAIFFYFRVKINPNLPKFKWCASASRNGIVRVQLAN